MPKNKDTTGLYILTIVMIVAFVGMVTAVLPSSVVSSENAVGAAIAKIPSSAGSFTEWTTCTDLGTQVKLGNKEGDIQIKKNTCTGKAGQKLLVDYFCAQDIDGYFIYKTANPVQCAAEKECLLDQNGAAYCG